MSWDDPNDVGYGRPPTWTRFQKGQSGNPKGRPRRAAPQPTDAPGQSEQDNLLRTALNRAVDITDRGKRRSATMGEVIVQRQIADASKGSILAQREVLRAARELEARDRERAAAEIELDISTFRAVVDKRDRQARAWKEAAARGAEPDNPWPHPDDYFLDRATYSWHIRGPASEKDVLFFEGLRADRDVMFVQTILYVRGGRSKRGLATLYAYMFMSFDVMLPQRWQMGVDRWNDYAGAFVGLPLRVLREILAIFERRARSIGRPALSPQAQKEVYKETNRLMQPILRKMGFRTLKQFEAAYADVGPKGAALRNTR